MRTIAAVLSLISLPALGAGVVVDLRGFGQEVQCEWSLGEMAVAIRASSLEYVATLEVDGDLNCVLNVTLAERPAASDEAAPSND